MIRIDFNRLRFLVIDDNAHMRRILRTLLHGFGARDVYEAEDGAAGLEAFTHFMPDIVITDWAMPIFDGLELTQMIRQPGANANPYVPIIMLTGHSEKKRVIAARDAGVTEFMAKPISAKALYQRILNVVANPRPFIKTKTYFGPDRRRNVHTPELCRARAPQGRQGRRHPADRRCSTRPRSPAEPGEASQPRAIMSHPRNDKPSVATFADHEVITPPNKLRKALSTVARTTTHDDPVARAEEALAAAVGRVRGLDGGGMRAARRRPPRGQGQGLHQGDARGAVPRRPRHQGRGGDLRLSRSVASAADSLCRLIEHTPDIARIPLDAGRPARRCGARHRARERAPRQRSHRRSADHSGCARSPTNFSRTRTATGRTTLDDILAPPLAPGER